MTLPATWLPLASPSKYVRVMDDTPPAEQNSEATAGRSVSPQENRYRIDALAKGLDVLRLFDDGTPSLTLRNVSDRTGIPTPTAFRIVATLEEKGFLERLPNGVIRPGLTLVSMGSAALRSSSIVQLSDPFLRQLADSTGETVNLGVLVGAQVLYLLRFENSGMVRADIQVGTTLPAAYTSIGKVLLAFLSPQQRRETLSGHAFRANAGPNAVESLEELEERLTPVRAEGYAVQDEELSHGTRSIAVPVFGRGPTPVAAINVAAGTTRQTMENLRGPTLEALRRTATDISQRANAI